MTKRERLTRENIVENLVTVLKPLDYVHALYEGGAAAFNRIDRWSDIDLYLVVDDEKVKDAFLVVENALKLLSPITQKLEMPQLPWPGVSQAFYKLRNTSEYLLIDLAVLKMGSLEKFLQPEIHGNVVFYFNKSDKIKIPEFNKIAFSKKLVERLDRLRSRFNMFNILVQKEINRGNYLEAIDLYHNLTLPALVEALRIKHNPLHHDFKTRYIHYELPSETILKLKRLHFIRDEKDLQRNYHKATEWIQEIMSEVIEEAAQRLKTEV